MNTKFLEVRAIQKAQIIPPDIIRIEADQNYSVLYLKSGKKLTMAKTLKQFEEMLDPYNFLRPCRSHLINIRFLSQVSATKVTLKNGLILPISRRRKREMISKFYSNKN